MHNNMSKTKEISCFLIKKKQKTNTTKQNNNNINNNNNNNNRNNKRNWRPISLLNVIYKLASSVIASRLKNVLHKLIHGVQKGLIAGRFIGDNMRLIYDILIETKQQEIPGLLLSVDFQQAFDSVSSKFI